MPTFQYVGLQQTTTKVLDLWNGASNNAPPANWFTTGFDDSAWPASVNPNIPAVGVFSGRYNPTLAVYNTTNGLPADAQPIAPWTTPPSVSASFVLRAHMTMPADWDFYFFEEFRANPLLVAEETNYGFFPVWINGTSCTTWAEAGAQFVVGDNVLAWGGSFAEVNAWNTATSSTGYVSFMVTFWQANTGGQATAWGTISGGVNDRGVLGTGDTSTHLTPTTCDPALPTNITKVVSNGTTTLFLTGDQEVWACGDNSTGLLGIGTTDASTHSTPVKILPSLTAPTIIAYGTIVDISIGFDCALAITREGHLWGWGPNAHGSFGRGNTTASTSPVRLVAGLPFTTSVDSIAAGGNFSALHFSYPGAARIFQNGLYTAGENASGQLGQGTAGADVVSRAHAIYLDVDGFNIGFPVIASFSAGEDKLVAFDTSANIYGAGPTDDGSLSFGNFDGGSPQPYLKQWTSTLSVQTLNYIQQVGPITFFTHQAGSEITINANGDGVPYGGAGSTTDVYGTTEFNDGLGDILTPDFLELSISEFAQGSPSHNPYTLGDSRIAFGAIGLDGLLYTWGYGGYGQMGSGADATTNEFAISSNGLTTAIAATFAKQIAFAVASTGTPTTVVTRSFGVVIG